MMSLAGHMLVSRDTSLDPGSTIYYRSEEEVSATTEHGAPPGGLRVRGHLRRPAGGNTERPDKEVRGADVDTVKMREQY